MVPFRMVIASGSKSQLGSGLLLAAFANNSAKVVDAPTATFLQKSGPAAVGALKVAGSHSSKATTCATLGESSQAAPPANSKHKRTSPDFIKLSLIAISFLCASAHTAKPSKLKRPHQRLFPGYEH